MNNIQHRFFRSREALHHSLLENTKYQLEKAIQSNGEASFMVSGGSTPKALYQSLATSEIAWHQITVGMVDERWVDRHSEASNEKFIRINLLNNKAAKSRFVNMKIENQCVQQAEFNVNQNYSQLNKPFDLTILGMGNDGHTASLFPYADGIEEALKNESKLCSAISAKRSKVTGEFTERMTLTAPAINRSRLIKLLITGKDKLDTYNRALAGDDIIEMPVRAILNQKQTPIVVYWAP
ncbi:MAG: 6-phosphogluconolactonase [Kangiellaceae bacterium]|nr:6-phosphogluconolactonase [Kangiellaceae bacterium]MCW8997333.1 6-phosphogluconolactonase [Kangiellaceae bacterium]